MSDGASFRSDARDQAQSYQAARDLHITYQQGESPGKPARFSLPHLLSCFADAPLPVSVLSPEAVAAVRMPGLSAERVASELDALRAASGAPSGADAEPAAAPAPGPPVACVRADPAAVTRAARELTDDARTQLSTCAAALLDHAMPRSPDGPELDLFAPHVMALLWRPGRDHVRPVAAARRVRDAYERRGRYEEALPFADRTVESTAGAAGPATGSRTGAATGFGESDARAADALALGQLHNHCGHFGEAEAVLRPLLAQAEQKASGRGLSLAGRTGPSLAEMLRENSKGPFTSRLSPVDCDVLAHVADVQHALADALYGQRRYAECERLLFTAVGLYWRVLGAAHPARILGQLHRARVLGRQRLWLEAVSLVRDALAFRDTAALERDSPRDDALIRLAHAEVTVAALRSLQEEGASRSRAVGMFPAPVVRFLDRTAGTNARLDKLTWDDARRLAEDAARACDRAFGSDHPRTRTARTLLDSAGGPGTPAGTAR
ncbi:tetratricopeptide repeat protein [Streptomyces piniterrae]|uniref:Tetratricopeptide repeat protein n=1 Tax=Streptomyces piniterrae TaxID=2571125 RepID=A0A4U0N7A5_9ACTN|nr:tetratricopeptide repeat protein [Streptomyces piniterrae]TJZ49677.1 tetratricopeptide repeat protein [Streptomyces piniterrae]